MQSRQAIGPWKVGSGPAVRFPAEKRREVKGRRLRWRDLLPGRWRRVVIQGQQYWLPR